jgi:multiple antibiotic resistance protein
MEISLEQVWVVSVSLFVAMNLVTTAPIYVSITEGLPDADRPQLVRSAVILAGVVAMIMAAVGSDLLKVMGVTIQDLRIAGGIVLLGLGFHDLVLSRGDRKSRTAGDVGPVPIGVPLLVGPATMTTLIVASEAHGPAVASLALLPNLVLAFVILYFAHRIVPIIGVAGARAFGKLMSLMLMAIGVAMTRSALMGQMVNA